jgi:hypothetical protein
MADIFMIDFRRDTLYKFKKKKRVIPGETNKNQLLWSTKFQVVNNLHYWTYEILNHHFEVTTNFQPNQQFATRYKHWISGGSHYGLLELWCTTRIITWKWQPISSDGKQKQTQFRTTEFHKWGQIVPHSAQMEYWTGGWTGNHCSKVETLETVKSNELVLVARPNA